jgi:hypothetical protein
MALVKGTNSYVTVAEANSYFDTRIDVAAWSSANETERGKALVTATMVLDNLDWTGAAVSDTQTLAFPRVGSYFDPRLGIDVELKATDIPSRILTATYELAYHLLNNDGLLDDTGEVDNLKIGAINLDNIKTPSKIPNVVKRIIRPLLVNKGSNMWWRAN